MITVVSDTVDESDECDIASPADSVTDTVESHTTAVMEGEPSNSASSIQEIDDIQQSDNREDAAKTITEVPPSTAISESEGKLNHIHLEDVQILVVWVNELEHGKRKNTSSFGLFMSILTTKDFQIHEINYMYMY